MGSIMKAFYVLMISLLLIAGCSQPTNETAEQQQVLEQPPVPRSHSVGRAEMDTLITLKGTTMKNYLKPWTTRCFILCWGCFFVLSAQAHGFAVGELFIGHPYAVPSLAGSQNRRSIRITANEKT